MTRQEANREILKLLSSMVEVNPDMRFIQLLYNCGFGGARSYYEESEMTLDKLKQLPWLQKEKKE